MPTELPIRSIDQTLKRHLDNRMAPVERLETLPRFIYNIELKISNPGRLTAEVEILTLDIEIDENDFEATPFGEWRCIIHPKQARDLFFAPKGQIVIDYPDMIELKDQDIVPFVITGEVTVTAKYGWVSKKVTGGFEINSSVKFY